MPNTFFRFKQFNINQDRCGMKVTTDGCVFGAWINGEDRSNVLDIGAGTGLLSLMLAQRSEARITAVELDPEAAAQCAENYRESPWSERLQVKTGAIQEIGNSLPGHFDLIMCNPPFYCAHPRPNAKNKVTAQHDQHLPMEALLKASQSLLAPEGELCVMYPEYQADAFIRAAEEYDLHLYARQRMRDTVSAPVLRSMMVFAAEKGAATSQPDLIIRDDAGNYTADFKRLLGPYYLHI